jgi:glycosyltransferase involved in cell wall biosynthesis
MDVFVFPTHREGLGRVLLEAAAAGKPVVSTLTTGVVDIVQDGITGKLVPPLDPTALADATGALLSHPTLAARMGACGRELVERHFDNSVYLERLGKVLESFTADRPSDGSAGADGSFPVLRKQRY